MRLRISERLFLPVDWMTLATVIYGSRGSGKTSLAAVFAEEISKARQRFCAIDLKGDLYGLKSTADGKGDGIPVVIFGGDHQDVPLEDGAGAFVGETVAGLGQSCVLDLEHFSKGKQVRFLAAFFEALYDRNRDPLLLILDEAQRYAPQGRMIDPDTAKCLGAVEDIVKLGRKHGIGPVLLTQRGSGLNKEVSELCDMLVAFRTPGPLDQERVKDWLDANTTKVQRDEVMGQLSGLPTGTAVFASGHPDLKIFGVYPVRRRETFDSSATPKVGQRRKEPKRLAKPDLDELKSKMSAAIERQKADDPKALRARIAELEREVKAKPAPAPPKAPKVQRVEVPVLSAKDRKLLDRVASRAADHAAAATTQAIATAGLTKTIVELIAKVAAAATCPEVPPSSPRSSSAVRHDARAHGYEVTAGGTPPTWNRIRAGLTNGTPIASKAPPNRTATTENASGGGGGGDMPAMDRKFLQALAQFETAGLSKSKMLALTGYRDTGSVSESLARLRRDNHITGDSNRLLITHAGIAAAGHIQALPTGQALVHYWANKLDLMAAAFLHTLWESGPLSKPDLLNAAGNRARSAPYKDTGSVSETLALLRRLDLVTGERNEPLDINRETFA